MEHTELAARESAFLEGRDEERLEELAGRIRERDREDQQLANMMLAHAVEKGRWLTEAKGLVPHGEWGAWLKREVDYSQSRAQELMRLFQRYGDNQESLFGSPKSQALGNLSVTQAIALLPLRDGPELDEFLETHDVEHMSTRELSAEVRAAQQERDEALKAAAQAQAEQAAAEAAREKAAQDMALANERLEGLNDLVERYSAEARERQEALAQANDQLAEQAARASEAQANAQRLAAELEELKNRPETVAVEVDEEAVEAARRETEAAMQAQVDAAKAAAEEARAELMEANSVVQRAKLEQEDIRRALEKAQAEAAALREQAGERKAALTADADLALFRALFGQTQELVKKLGEMLVGFRDKEPEKAQGLARSLLALADKIRGVAEQ